MRAVISSLSACGILLPCTRVDPVTRVLSLLAKLIVCEFTGFVLRHPLLASAVIGATSTGQLKELLDVATEQPPLSDEIMAEIDKIHRQYPNPAP